MRRSFTQKLQSQHLCEVRVKRIMPFIIIRADGRPLVMHDGAVIVFETADSARPWLQLGERIEEAPAGMDSVRSMDAGTPKTD